MLKSLIIAHCSQESKLVQFLWKIDYTSMIQQFNLQVYTSKCVCIQQKTYLSIFIVIPFILTPKRKKPKCIKSGTDEKMWDIHDMCDCIKVTMNKQLYTTRWANLTNAILSRMREA